MHCSASFLQPTPAPEVEGGIPSQEEQPGSAPATVTAQNPAERGQLSLPWPAAHTQHPACTAPASAITQGCEGTSFLTSSELPFPPELSWRWAKPVLAHGWVVSAALHSSLEGSGLQYKRKVVFYSQDV